MCVHERNSTHVFCLPIDFFSFRWKLGKTPINQYSAHSKKKVVVPTKVLNDINESKKKTNKNADSWIGILPKFRGETDKKLSTNLSILCNGIPGVFCVQTKRLLMFCQTTIFIILFERFDRVSRTRFTSLTIIFFLFAFFLRPNYIFTSIQVKVHKLVFVPFTCPQSIRSFYTSKKQKQTCCVQTVFQNK